MAFQPPVKITDQTLAIEIHMFDHMHALYGTLCMFPLEVSIIICMYACLAMNLPK